MNRLRFWPLVVAASLVTSMLLFAPAASASEGDTTGTINEALGWLVDQQLEDGGFPGFDGASDPGATADAVIALAAASKHTGEEFQGIPLALEYLESTAEGYAETQAGASKLVMAFAAANQDPRDVAGLHLLELLNERSNEESGAYDEQVFIHANAMLAVLAASGEIIDGADEFLVDRQIEDGSWAFTGDTAPGMGDTNTTAMALQALVAAGLSDHDAVTAGIEYILDAQLDDGSVVYAIGAEDPPLGDSNSTALAVQAMLAAGLTLDEDTVVDALDALLGFQNNSGALGYREDMPEDNALSTAQALPAMLGLPLPITGPQIEGTDTEEAADHEVIEPGDPDRCDYFEQTGHNLCHGFRDFWWDNGGLAIFGYPLTEELEAAAGEGNDTVIQYFERAQFEYNPELPEGGRISHVSLGPDIVDNLERTEIIDPVGPCDHLGEAQHGVCGVFLEYWNQYGGEEIFGLPITEPFGSHGMMVQIFEYARFEHQPGEWPERNDVLLGRIGAEVLAGDAE